MEGYNGPFHPIKNMVRIMAPEPLESEGTNSRNHAREK